MERQDDTITSVRHWLVRMPFRHRLESANARRTGATRLVVEITTASGIKGYGETSALLDVVETVAERVVAPLALGKRASDIERLHRHVLGAGYYHHKRAAVMALCAVEMAMWDALARIANQPLCQLWGGRWRNEVEVAAYALIGDPVRLAEELKTWHAEGYSQFKIKIGSGEAKDIALVRAARDALGEGVHLRADVNGAWTRPTARRQLEKLRECDLAYVEQPLELDDLEGHAELRRLQPTPIALDESVYTPQDMANVVRAAAADVVLADPHEAGGLWQARKVATIAEVFGLPATLHSGGELGISQAANLHLAASLPEMRYAIDTQYALYDDDILPERLAITQGRMAVPTGPGLGVVPDLEKLERYRTDRVRGAYLDERNPGWFPTKPAY